MVDREIRDSKFDRVKKNHIRTQAVLNKLVRKRNYQKQMHNLLIVNGKGNGETPPKSAKKIKIK